MTVSDRRESTSEMHENVSPLDTTETMSPKPPSASRRRAHPRARRRDGHDDPEAKILGGGFSRARASRTGTRDLKGNNDLLILTQPDKIRDIHLQYFRAGADIVETNTFSSTTHRAGRLRHGGAGLRAEPRGRASSRGEAGDIAAKEDGRPRFVAGAHRARPTAPPRSRRTSTIRASAPSASTSCATAYGEAARGLIDGGADLLLIETIFDTLNAKAAIFALEQMFAERGQPRAGDDLRHDHGPVRPHAVRPDADRVLERARHARPISIGLNCALGAREMRAHIAEICARRRHAGLRLSECRPAERVRPLRREPGGDGATSSASSPRPAWSTSWAAAAARRRSTSRRSPRP